MVRSHTRSDDYADRKDHEMHVVREALNDATDDELADLFDDVTRHLGQEDVDGTVRIDTVVVPAMVARKGLEAGFGRYRFDPTSPRAIPGDGGERVVFHACPEDDPSSLRNRVLQALTPTDHFVAGP